MFSTFIFVTHVVLCFAIIALVMVQQGPGANAGAAFGSGASGTVFGAAGKANFLVKLTQWLVVLFFVTSLAMMFNSGKISGTKSVLDETPVAPLIEETDLGGAGEIPD